MLGLLLAAAVHISDIQDRDDTRLVLARPGAAFHAAASGGLE